MRNFAELSPETQKRLIGDFESNAISYADMESIFDVDPGSFRAYLIDKVNTAYEAFAPPPPAPKLQWMQPFKKLAGQICISLLLLISTFALTFGLEHAGIDPLTNELSVNFLRAACITIGCFGFVDWFLFWKDPELFGYAESTIQSTNDANQDFNQLTPYQRCTMLMLRYLLYAFVFALSFVALNMT